MITLQGTPWLYNSSYLQQLTMLNNAGYRSPLKDNGPVLFADVKPVTDYDRYFLRSLTASQEGYNRARYADGTVYDGTTMAKQFTPLDRHYLYLPYSNTWYNPGSTSSVMYGAPPSINDWSVLRGNIAAKAKSLGFDAGTFIVERRKTIDYLRTAIPKFLVSARRVAASAARSAGKGKGVESIGNEWLAARYGLRPLLYDIENAVKAYEIGLSPFLRAFATEGKTPEVASLAAWAVPRALFFSSKTPNNPPGFVHGSTNCAVVTDYSCRASAGVGTYLQSFATFNPSLTMLELVPFSFLLGWVCNIPEQLIAHAPVFDREVLYYCLGMKRSKTFTYSISWKGNPSFSYYINGNSGFTAKGYHEVDCKQTIVLSTDVYSRRRIDPTDVPWAFSTNFNLSSLQLADLAALARQQYAKIKRI